jgi:hypothetical protein
VGLGVDKTIFSREDGNQKDVFPAPVDILLGADPGSGRLRGSPGDAVLTQHGSFILGLRPKKHRQFLLRCPPLANQEAVSKQRGLQKHP